MSACSRIRLFRSATRGGFACFTTSTRMPSAILGLRSWRRPRSGGHSVEPVTVGTLWPSGRIISAGSAWIRSHPNDDSRRLDIHPQPRHHGVLSDHCFTIVSETMTAFPTASMNRTYTLMVPVPLDSVNGALVEKGCGLLHP